MLTAIRHLDCGVDHPMPLLVNCHIWQEAKREYLNEAWCAISCQRDKAFLQTSPSRSITLTAFALAAVLWQTNAI